MTDASALVAVIEKALLAEGAGPGGGLHGWRCEYPDRYGDCECVNETAWEIARAVVTAMRGNLGDDERCYRCGGANVIWSAQSPLWNYVMRGNDINGEPLFHDLVCMPCFVVLAEGVGVKGSWHLTVAPEPDELVKVTPSGRVWDAERWLWVQPA